MKEVDQRMNIAEEKVECPLTEAAEASFLAKKRYFRHTFSHAQCATGEKEGMLEGMLEGMFRVSFMRSTAQEMSKSTFHRHVTWHARGRDAIETLEKP